jgi:hypothetical protein
MAIIVQGIHIGYKHPVNQPTDHPFTKNVAQIRSIKTSKSERLKKVPAKIYVDEGQCKRVSYCSAYGL